MLNKCLFHRSVREPRVHVPECQLQQSEDGAVEHVSQCGHSLPYSRDHVTMLTPDL